MATKIMVIGKPEQKQVEPIKLISCLTEYGKDFGTDLNNGSVTGWGNAELICKQYRSSGMDLIFVYDMDRNNGLLMFGYWNDGIV